MKTRAVNMGLGVSGADGVARAQGSDRMILRSITILMAGLGLAISLPGAPASAKPREFKRKPTPVPLTTAEMGLDEQPEPAAARTGPVGKIVVPEPNHDFGEVWMGPKLEHTFVIKNEGEGPLNIERVRPACGCTLAGKHPKVIEPGQSGEFPFTLNSKKLRGKYEKSISIQTDDPLTPNMRLKLRGVCKRYVDVVPTNANFGKIAFDEAHKRVLKITNNTDRPLELALDKTEDSEFKFELIEKVPNKNFELHVSMKPPYSAGRHQGRVVMTSNFEEQKEIKTSASARIPNRLDLQPAVVKLNVTRLEKAYKRPIRFYNYGKTEVKVLDATCDDPLVKVEVQERSAGRSYILSLDIPKGYMPPPEGKTITVKTDDPAQPTILLPLKPPSTYYAKKDGKLDLPPQKRPAELMVGKPAPAFALTTTAGKSLANKDLKGNVTVLDFFAPNCGYCKKQIPRMEEIRKEYESKGVRFVTVSQTMRKPYTDDQVKDTIKGLGFQGELAINHDNSAGKAFKAASFPTMYVVGKGGTIDAVNVGNVGDLETRMRGQLNALLAGKPVPAVEKTAATKPKPKKRPAQELVGKPAPSFSFETMAGKKMASADLAKYPATVLNFVAPNCGFCKKQIPRLEQIRKSYEAKGVRFINVAETMRKKFTPEETADIFKKTGSNLELAYDGDNKVGPLFKASGFPTMVVLGKSGKVEAVNIGNIGDLESKLKGQLDALIAGKPVPTVDKTAATKPKPRKRPAQELVGKPAPAFSFEAMDGKKMASADLAKYPATVLNFVAPNCGYCKKQVPRLEQIRKSYEAKGVQFFNVAETMRKKYTPEETADIFKKTGSNITLAYDGDNKVGPLFKAVSFPTMVVLGKSGKVEAVNIGNIGDLESRVKGQLDALIAGKPAPTVDKEAAAKPPQKRSSPTDRIGKPAPKYSFQTMDGKKVTTADLANHPATVLNIVAPNCGYCKKQVPRTEKLRQEYQEKGVRFVNVIQTMRKKYAPEEAAKVFTDVGSKLELAYDGDNTAGAAFGRSGFPTMIILGKSGKVEAVNIGNIGDLETRVKGQLDALIAGKPVPVVAQAAAKPPQKRSSPTDRIGKPAPKYSFQTMDGKKVTTAD
ncbi:MAG: redoxin domain-containing protein, partial [Planctomycetota bacterium]